MARSLGVVVGPGVGVGVGVGVDGPSHWWWLDRQVMGESILFYRISSGKCLKDC